MSMSIISLFDHHSSVIEEYFSVEKQLNNVRVYVNFCNSAVAGCFRYDYYYYYYYYYYYV